MKTATAHIMTRNKAARTVVGAALEYVLGESERKKRCTYQSRRRCDGADPRWIADITQDELIALCEALNNIKKLGHDVTGVDLYCDDHDALNI